MVHWRSILSKSNKSCFVLFSKKCKTYLNIINVCIYICFSCVLTLGQSIDLTLTRSTVDTEDLKVCYEISITNNSTQSINLAGQNYRLFYDSEILNFDQSLSTSLLTMGTYTDINIVQSLENVDGSNINGTLPYESNLGFLNFFIDLNDTQNGGDLISPNNGMLTTTRLCFDIVSTGSQVCPFIDLAEEGVTQQYAPVFCNISVWQNSSLQVSATIDNLTNITPLNDNSCFYLNEDSFEICTDGLDNDNDGLVDCDDPDCNAINIVCEYLFCGDGVDNDGDGLIDCDDNDCITPTIEDVTITPIESCTNLQSGVITISSSTNSVEYSIDGGDTFFTDSTFFNLESGQYTIVIKSLTSGCHSQTQIANIDSLGCEQYYCNDNIDNDGDGLIDCADLDCPSPSIDSIELILPTCDMTGALTIFPNDENYEFSTDGGMEYSNINNISISDTGTYLIAVRDIRSGCESLYELNPVKIDSIACDSISVSNETDCFDGIDNDGDGLVDCEDLDCNLFFKCQNAVVFSNILNRNSDNNFISMAIGENIADPIVFINIYDRWGNVMYSDSSNEIKNKLTKINIPDIDQWTQGVYILKCDFTSPSFPNGKSLIKTITVL